ncbi:hypothetical protein GFS31_11960 [Leptolyngbya sp. BL0902]|uniref:sigma-70 family RNA polymerase sigma factor n=1 Tax=Leptolyngbya sp. BL0902 TaxID=1115757 RepID=UPI0018E8C717|nr:sigma-70 family RNA polymerase sigma factor [Leptolyngbya sp. BL0902]QQE64515.1 hypothetical protein GFS31_11960 [Leptolyngbya sp. BL0902]
MDVAQPSQGNVGEPTDTDLWLDLCAGQQEALGQLYDRHAGLVYGIALKLLANSHEAEDLTQDIFLKLPQTNAYDPQRGSLRTFLAIMTRSRALDRLRSRSAAQNSASRLQTLQPTASTPPEDHLHQAEQWEQVQAALAQLSDPQRQVLRMAYYEGMTQATIAEQLNTPLGTVKAHARRGLLKLRHLLHDYRD